MKSLDAPPSAASSRPPPSARPSPRRNRSPICFRRRRSCRPSSPFQLALKRGYYAKNNVAVKFQTGTRRRRCRQAGRRRQCRYRRRPRRNLDDRAAERPAGARGRAARLASAVPAHRRARRATSSRFKELKGKKLGVIGYQDTSYYALLARAGGERPQARRSRSPGRRPGRRDAADDRRNRSTASWRCRNGPSRSRAPASRSTTIDIESIFPAMAQAILASDKIIKERPAAVGGFVKAVMLKRCATAWPIRSRPPRTTSPPCRSMPARRR